MTKNFDFSFCRVIPTDLVLGPFFVTFFSEKVPFSLEGLVKVRYLVLARTKDDFGATLPCGSI